MLEIITMDKHVWIVLLCIAVTGTAVLADEVYLVNGDKISGKVQHLVNGKLTFESELAGTLTIDLANIATLKTNEPIEVHLADGTAFNQQIVKSESGRFGIAGDETLKPQEFDLSTVASINPPAKLQPTWHGDISGGITATRGNTVTDNQSLSVNLKKRTEKDRSLLSADYIRGKQKDPDTGEKKTTEDEWRMRGKYDYFFTKKFFGYLDGRYEKDRIANLDRRVILGAGGGYQWVESDDFNFSTEAGLASMYEKFDDQTDSTSNVSAQLGYHLDKRLTKTLLFINDLTYYPSIEQVSDYFLTTTAELRASITEKMFTNFKVIFDYDSTPAQDAGSTDVKYILGVGWSF